MTDVQTLLPPNATRVERSIEQAAAAALAIDVFVDRLWSVEDCPVALLPWLAWTIGVESWRPDWPEATKRAVIAATPLVKRRKGTAAAVKAAIAAVAEEKSYRIVEWFDPEGSGEPYTGFAEIDFTDADLTKAQASAGDLIAAVEGSKPLRSRFTARLRADMRHGLRVASLLRPASLFVLRGIGTVQPRLTSGVVAATHLRPVVAAHSLRGVHP